jgi:hypothetical protein
MGTAFLHRFEENFESFLGFDQPSKLLNLAAMPVWITLPLAHETKTTFTILDDSQLFAIKLFPVMRECQKCSLVR